MVDQSEQNHSWVSEFKEFLDVEPRQVPQHLSQKIMEEVHQKLNPPLGQVFFRLALIHSFISIFILSICPQFGIQIIPGMTGLTAVFMRVSMPFCMLACGLVFMGAGIGAVIFLFPPEYIKALKRYELFHLVLLTFLSCGVLVALGEVSAFSWIGLWLLGGIAGSFFSFEFGYRLRFGH